jgi:C4-dicarboxylate-specific signal transduction histidine kinase
MGARRQRLARLPERTLKAFGILLPLAFAVLCQCAAVRADDPPRRILLLHPYNYSLPSTTTLAESVRSRLMERAPRKVEIDGEHLDLARNTEPAYEAWMTTFLRERYERTPPDVIVALGDALPFAVRNRDKFAPTTPVVFVSISPETHATVRPPSDMTGTLFDTAQHLSNTLTLAEGLQPGTRRLFVIAGSSSLDRRWQATARRVVEGRARKFETTWLFDLSYDRIVEGLSRVPRDSIVLLLTVFEDSTGKSFIPVEVAETLLKLSPAPAYAPYYTVIGKGSVGGSSETFEAMGTAAADQVLEIFSGKSPASIPVQTSRAPTFRVDHRAMQRWGLSEKNLPVGTTVMFKEPTIWEQHRGFVLAAIAVIALQSVFAGVLLLERRSRTRAEALLTESEERMTLTAAAANVGLWQFDPKTGELWATEHCRTLFGLGPDVPLVRASFLAAIHPEDREGATAALRHASNSDLPASNDVRVVWPDLQIRWIRIVARSHQANRRDPKHLSGTFIDISDQKAAEVEAALQRREVAHLTRVSALGELSGAIAHEINQPLTAILFNAQAALHLLSQSEPDIDEARNALDDIVQEDNRAAQVIRRLKTLLKKGEGIRERVDLNGLVNETVTLLNSELIGRAVSIQVVPANDLPATSGDPVQLQQVLINLIVNAIDAMASTPASQRLITISTRATRNGGAELVVKDRGTGVDALEQSRIFEPFFTTKQHGLGLGLTICSSIVESHGGKLSLTNSPGGGAEARLSLPAQEVLIAAQ